MNWRNLLFFGLLAFAAPLFAQEEEAAEEESPWSGNVKLGYLAVSGNTESQSMNAGFEVNYKKGLWVMEADYAANEIWKQVEARKGIHVFDWRYRMWAFLLRRILPASIGRFIVRRRGTPK